MIFTEYFGSNGINTKQTFEVLAELLEDCGSLAASSNTSSGTFSKASGFEMPQLFASANLQFRTNLSK